MERIRHSDRLCYVEEGHGGREIEAWPIYRFFRDYVNGRPDQAAADFAHWYYQQFMRYRHVPKRIGGMQAGSLARMLETIKNDKKNLQPLQNGKEVSTAELESEVLRDAIAVRVKQRFKLVDSIRDHGYVPDSDDPIIGIRKNSFVYLEAGHHRAAALRVLRWQVLPQVLIFSGPLLYRLWQQYRGVMHALGRRLHWQ